MMEIKVKESLGKELVSVLLKKAGITEKDVYKVALKKWVSQNLDLLTPEEGLKYKPVLL